MKRSKLLLSLVLLLGTVMGAQAQQKRVEMEIVFLTSETIAEVNIDQEVFLPYLKLFDDQLEQSLSQITVKADVFVVQTVHKTGPVSVDVYARPALSTGERQKIKDQLLAIKAPATKLVDFPLLFKAKVNGGLGDSKLAFAPEFSTPAEKQLADFQQKDLAGEVDDLKTWVREQAIPVLAAFETKVDDKFAGVKAVGSLLTTTDWRQKQDVAALTERNSMYWRACLEMSLGNQLIPVSKAFLYAAQGEHDKALLYLRLMQPVSDPKSVPFTLGEELKERLRVLKQKEQAEIEKGIALHDKGKYAAAIAAYDQLLAAYPASAWGNYERYFSQNALSMVKSKVFDEKLWDKAKVVVYACDPMYPMDMLANSGKQAVLLFKRKHLAELFKAGDTFKADYNEYADTALQLGEYGLAAQLNWIIFSSFPKEEQGPDNRLATFLYCLDKLGDKEVIKNFKGDFKKEFALMDARFDKEMKENATYKAFAK